MKKIIVTIVITLFSFYAQAQLSKAEVEKTINSVNFQELKDVFLIRVLQEMMDEAIELGNKNRRNANIKWQKQREKEMRSQSNIDIDKEIETELDLKTNTDSTGIFN